MVVIPRLRSSSGRRSGRLTSFVRPHRFTLWFQFVSHVPVFLPHGTIDQPLHVPNQGHAMLPANSPRRFSLLCRRVSTEASVKIGSLGVDQRSSQTHAITHHFSCSKVHSQGAARSAPLFPCGLTLRSTRTQPALAAFMSLGRDSSSPFIFRSPVGPVNFFR